MVKGTKLNYPNLFLNEDFSRFIPYSENGPFDEELVFFFFFSKMAADGGVCRVSWK